MRHFCSNLEGHELIETATGGLQHDNHTECSHLYLYSKYIKLFFLCKKETQQPACSALRQEGEVLYIIQL